MFNFFKKNKKQTATIKYRDEHDVVQEKQVASEKIDELLKKGTATQVYKVLIKGPWNGVKEDYWELSQDVVDRFGDEESTIHVLCVYEKGEPTYNYVAKQMWEKFDKIGEITSNPNLSSEQQAAEIKKYYQSR
jgi:hypothetical protein